MESQNNKEKCNSKGIKNRKERFRNILFSIEQIQHYMDILQSHSNYIYGAVTTLFKYRDPPLAFFF